MAFVHSKGSAVSIDDNDLSAYANSITFGRTADSHDVTTFGKSSRVYASGLKDSTATIEGIYDDTAGTGPGAVLRPLVGAGPVELVYEPEGTGSGKPIATVDVIVTSYEESSAVGDMIMWTAELQGTDDIADSTGGA